MYQSKSDTDLRMSDKGRACALRNIAKIRSTWNAEKQAKTDLIKQQKAEQLQAKIDAYKQVKI